MNRAKLLAGTALAAGAAWLAGASYVLQQGLTFFDPARFLHLSYTPWLWAEAVPLMGSNRLVGQLVPITGALAALPAVMAGVVAAKVARWNAGRPLFGESRFSRAREARQTGLVLSARPRPDCVTLGRTKGWWPRYVGLPGCQHVLLFAKTRSGKGVSFVVPNAFSFGDSLVVLDVKRENFDRTAGHRASVLRQAVFLFQPLAEDGRTHCWNPLGGIDASRPDYISKLQRRAFDIFPDVQGKDRFWQDGARNAFLGIAVLLAETPGEPLNPHAVFRWFARGDAAAELKRRIEARRQIGNPHSQTCVDLISDYLTGTEEVVKGVRKHVTATMGLWFNPKIAAATARSDFSLRELRRKRMTVYVAVMPSDLGQLGVLLRLFFTQLFESNTDVLPEQDRSIRYRCHVLLDEFTSIPPMKAFAKAAGFAAGFGLQFSYVVQSKNQVREEYKGQGEASLLENVGAEIIFGTDDPVLCREASERAGYDTVEAFSETKPRWWAGWRWARQNRTESLQKRALLLPQEVARMPNDEEIVFRASVPPFLLRKLCWHEDEHFQRLERRPPPVPVISYQLARDDGTVTIPVPDGQKAKARKQEKAGAS